ncbi:MAG: signal peptide peptidase SppA [Rikenellaceae bacterium]|nr:signal peptide peptidase SppA [Rikenellaceae bacterium]
MKNFFKIVLGTFVGSLIALTVGFFLMLGFIGSMASFSETKPVVPKSAILSIDFGTRISEQSIDDPFSSINPLQGTSGKTQGIYSLIRSIDKAATDPAIKFIYMNLSSLNAGITHTEELRSALERFRTSGKPVIAYADNFSQPAYYLSTVADKIFLSPTGMLPLTGVSISTIFFKDLLDKLGVEVQLVRHGKFKAAAEQFISNKMSPENREQLQAYVNAVWSTWASQIASAREIPVEKINLLADNLSLSTAQDALEAGLVDELLYKDQLIEKLTTLFGVEDEKDLKMISTTNYDKATHKVDFKEKNKVAIIYANGDIIMGKAENNIASDSFMEHISKVRKDSTIKAVVFRVNSPGGSAQSSDIIERELALLMENKPVVVSMGDYAASGGYWISAKANKIFTNNTTLTGSIGVFSMVPNFQKAMNKHLSVNAESVNSNKYSDLMSGYRPLESTESEFLRSAVEKIYTDFINLVAQGRNMTPEKVDEIAQGRVWAGKDALGIGLADQQGGLYDALLSAASMAGLEGYRIVEYPVQKSAIDRLVEMLSESSVAAGNMADPLGMLENAYQSLLKERGISHMARLPYNITFN